MLQFSLGCFDSEADELSSYGDKMAKKNRFKFLSCLHRNISRISAQVSRTVKDFRFSIYPGFMGAGRRSESMDRFLILVSIAKGRLIRILLVCTKISSSKAKRAK